MKNTIVPAEASDLQVLSDMFWKHISSDTDYISHGEMQMGVGVPVIVNGEIKGRPAKHGKDMWDKYIKTKFESPEASVMKCLCEGKIAGFCVTEITEDGADPFGIICDILVDSPFRSKGIGEALLNAGISWLRSHGIKDIYLESGKNNHSAHRFFESKGFRHISDIFRLMPDEATPTE